MAMYLVDTNVMLAASAVSELSNQAVRAMPQEIEFVEKVPKTRSGKIMRRLLRAKEWGQETGDTSTLEDD